MDEKVDQLKVRLGKLEKIRELGTEPYPYSFEQSLTLSELMERADELIENQQILQLLDACWQSGVKVKPVSATFRLNTSACRYMSDLTL